MGGIGGGGGGAQQTQTIQNLLPSYAEDYVMANLNASFERFQNLVLGGGLCPATAYFNPNLYDIDNPLDSSAVRQVLAERNSEEEGAITSLKDRGYDGSSEFINKAKPYMNDLFPSVSISGGETNTTVGTSARAVAQFTREKEKAIQQLDESFIPSINSESLLLGRYGGNSHHARTSFAIEGMMEKLSESAKTIFGHDIRKQRQWRHNVLPNVPAYANERIYDYEQLKLAGLYEREYEQGFYTTAYKIFLENQERPHRYLEILGNAVRAVIGSHTSSTSPYYLPSPISQLAGVAMTGISAYATYKHYSSMGAQPSPQIPQNAGSGGASVAGEQIYQFSKTSPVGFSGINLAGGNQ